MISPEDLKTVKRVDGPFRTLKQVETFLVRHGKLGFHNASFHCTSKRSTNKIVEGLNEAGFVVHTGDSNLVEVEWYNQ